MFIAVIDFRRCWWKAVIYWDTQHYESFKRILYLFGLKAQGQVLLLVQQAEQIKSRTTAWSLDDVGVMLCLCPPFRSVVVHNLWCQWTLWPHTEPVQWCLQELQAQSGRGGWRDPPRHSDLESTSNQHIQVRELSLIVVMYLCLKLSKLQLHARHFWSITFRSLATSTGVLLVIEAVIPSLSSLGFVPWKMQLFWWKRRNFLRQANLYPKRLQVGRALSVAENEAYSPPQTKRNTFLIFHSLSPGISMSFSHPSPGVEGIIMCQHFLQDSLHQPLLSIFTFSNLDTASWACKPGLPL